ncbi:MAG TPA: Na+/H+ antiporter subunit E [Rickettsiales bacterium]|nr:Na+/H+ antiporter subunit E [Rickettsiales bacterium]
MLNKFTLFLLLFIIWITSLFLSNTVNVLLLITGFIISIIITLFVFKTSIIGQNTEFLFLQFGFYKYIFGKIINHIKNVFIICSKFYKKDIKFTSILDYVFLNKDSDAESALVANLLTLIPGTMGILMKKRYLIVHSLDEKYFSLSEMYNITVEVGKIDDDSLI